MAFRHPRAPRHPSYNVLITGMLAKVPPRSKGLSLHAIRKSIQDKYKLPESCRRHILLAIRRCLRVGIIAHGNSTQMYKLGKKGQKMLAKRNKAPLRALRKQKKASPSATPAGSPAMSPASSPKTTFATKIAKKTKKTIAPATPKPIGSIGKAAIKPYIWQYTDDAGRFQNYDALASDTVEECYEEYLKNPHMMDVRAVRSGDWQYQVDFLQMKQTNILHQNHRVRTIRRVPNPIFTSA